MVGSVHFLGERRAVDDDDYDVWERDGRPRPRLARYFETLAEAARSGLYDILAHPDLVKVWGAARPRPERDPRFYYEPAVEAIAETGVAVEVSTAGCASRSASSTRRARSPRCASMPGPRSRSPQTRTCPSDVGYEYERAVEAMRGWGIERDRPCSSAASAAWSRWDERVGIGYDSHRFASGRRLVLGGVEIEHDAGLAGHSDADVLTHAVIDALLGAAGLGDLGTHFPARRRALARRRLARPAAHRASGMLPGPVVNVDATVICEAPRLAPHREEMERNLSTALGAPVSVKATTNEGMGFIGRGEGVACIAVALVESTDRRHARE